LKQISKIAGVDFGDPDEAAPATDEKAAARFERTKEASIEAIGYICSDVKPELLSAQSNLILTSICSGLLANQNQYIRQAAITALFNSLEFVKINFEKENERSHIMQVVCNQTVKDPNNGDTDITIRTRAMECLVKIAMLYYEHIQNYMQEIFKITISSMDLSQPEQIILQAIEFWSTICDEEMDLILEAEEARESGQEPTRVSNAYADGALPHLCPKLTILLTQQDDDTNTDEWSPSKAAGVCLMNLANSCGNSILPQVMEFIGSNFENPKWQNREAALMCFGSILEGPSVENLKPAIDQAFPIIVKAMSDPSAAVRDTAAWFVGRVCDIVPEAVLNPNIFEHVLQAMVNGLADEPRVAQNICWAFSSLSDAAYDHAQNQLGTEDTPTTYCMSRFFGGIIEKLLVTTNRQDGNQENLRNAAYEAIMELMKNAPDDCYDIVLKTTEEVMSRIQNLFAMENGIDSSMMSQYHDMQGLLCATLTAIIRKVKPEHMNELSDKCMEYLLKMLAKSNGVGSVQEDALGAVGTLIEVVGKGFEKYMPHFKPYLILALENHAEIAVCIAGVGVVTDLCRAMGKDFKNYFEEIMTKMYNALISATIDRNVKPQIVAAIGDAALAIGPDFSQYLAPVMDALQQAASFEVSTNDYEMLDYQTDLRESCLDAFTGIIQGLKGTDENSNPQASQVRALEQYLPFIFDFLCKIAENTEDMTDSLLKNACGLIGDISMVFGSMIPQNQLMQAFSTQGVQSLLQLGNRSRVDRTKRLAGWAIRQIRKIERGQA